MGKFYQSICNVQKLKCSAGLTTRIGWSAEKFLLLLVLGHSLEPIIWCQYRMRNAFRSTPAIARPTKRPKESQSIFSSSECELRFRHLACVLQFRGPPANLFPFSLKYPRRRQKILFTPPPSSPTVLTLPTSIAPNSPHRSASSTARVRAAPRQGHCRQTEHKPAPDR